MSGVLQKRNQDYVSIRISCSHLAECYWHPLMVLVCQYQQMPLWTSIAWYRCCNSVLNRDDFLPDTNISFAWEWVPFVDWIIFLANVESLSSWLSGSKQQEKLPEPKIGKHLSYQFNSMCVHSWADKGENYHREQTLMMHSNALTLWLGTCGLQTREE